MEVVHLIMAIGLCGYNILKMQPQKKQQANRWI